MKTIILISSILDWGKKKEHMNGIQSVAFVDEFPESNLNPHEISQNCF